MITGQNEHSQWYFPYNAGLNFLTNPPTPLPNANMPFNPANSASIADAAGNLLFYSNGLTIWNPSHAVMANGGGLKYPREILIARHPGNANLFYLFSIVQTPTDWPHLEYHLVDMSLSAGQGSVIAKNVVVSSQTCTGLTGTYHCNGKDIWIVTHEVGNNNFRSYLVSSAGLNTVAVISGSGLNHLYILPDGPMKISPSGNKIGVTVSGVGNTFRAVEVLDFNNTTGLVSNPITLLTEPLGTAGKYFEGIEFAPDNSKLYAGGLTGPVFYQWDLCAGDPAAIIASQYTLTLPAPGINRGMQLAQNGKIYIAQNGGGSPAYTSSLHVINAPNNAGAACNVVSSGQSIGPVNTSQSGKRLPNFFLRYRNDLSLSNFTYSIAPSLGCHALSFTAAPYPVITCASANYSVTGISWNFGDPASLANNISTSPNPVHLYPEAGSYTVMQIFHYPCGSDTVRQVVFVPPPYISAASMPGCDNNNGSATVTVAGGTGPYSYTWSPSLQTGSTVSNLASGIYTVTVFDQGLQCIAKATVAVNNFSLPPITIQPSTLLTLCAGSQTIVTLGGVSGGFSWMPAEGLGSTGNGTILVSSGVSQSYTITSVTNSCTNRAVLSVSVLPLPGASIKSGDTIYCANSTVTFTGSGGTNYLWKLPDQTFAYGPVISTKVKNTPGNVTYTLVATDHNGCSDFAYQTLSVLPAPDGYLAGMNNTVCVPFCGTFSFLPSTSTSTIHSNWMINGQSSANSVSFCLYSPGNYALTGNLSDIKTLCASKVYSTITAFSKPTADFSYTPEDITAEIDEPVFSLSNNYSGELQCMWSFLDGNQVSEAEGHNVIHKYEEAGIYPVTLVVKNAQGCMDTMIKAIEVNLPKSIYVPNSFTPNSDQLNDEFKPIITGKEIRKYNFCVFDRWGEKLFETENIDEGWNGSFKGSPCKEDVYAWKIRVVFVTRAEILTGQVFLYR